MWILWVIRCYSCQNRCSRTSVSRYYKPMLTSTMLCSTSRPSTRTSCVFQYIFAVLKLDPQVSRLVQHIARPYWHELASLLGSPRLYRTCLHRYFSTSTRMSCQRASTIYMTCRQRTDLQTLHYFYSLSCDASLPQLFVTIIHPPLIHSIHLYFLSICFKLESPGCRRGILLVEQNQQLRDSEKNFHASR